MGRDRESCQRMPPIVRKGAGRSAFESSSICARIWVSVAPTHQRFVTKVNDSTIRPAYSDWSRHDAALRDVVAGLSAEDLARRPGPERWPLWASIGHLACQRVFWLCDFAGAPGAETTRFTNATADCPGDDDLEHVLTASELVDALDATFRIVEWCLDHWTLGSLEDVIRHPEWDGSWVKSRGSVIQRVFAHDISHISELNEALATGGLARIDLWA